VQEGLNLEYVSSNNAIGATSIIQRITTTNASNDGGEFYQ